MNVTHVISNNECRKIWKSRQEIHNRIVL